MAPLYTPYKNMPYTLVAIVVFNIEYNILSGFICSRAHK